MSTSSPSRSIWRDVREAIAGSDADYTAIPLPRAIFLLAVPMILELVMESVFAVVDIFFVGKLGPSAIAAVGLTETYMFLLYSVAMGLSTAVTAIVARRVGEQKSAEAGLAASQAIIAGVCVAAPFMIAGMVYSRDLMVLMGGDPWVVDQGSGYTQWLLGGSVVVSMLFVMNAVFRGAGDAAVAMWVLWVANALNIVLDPILIYGFGPIPAFGIEGAAMATTIGRGTAVVIQLWLLFRGAKHIQVVISQLRLHAETMLNLIRTSLGGIGQMIVAMTAWIFLMRILADIGSDAVAAATITIRVMMFTMMPAWGLSNAAATLVGQNLGAGEPGRAETSVWKIGTYTMGYLIMVSIVFFTLSDVILGFFTSDVKVIAIGSEWMRILSYSYFVYGWWMVSVQAFNGAGDTRTPMYINLVFFWAIQIPLAWALALQAGWGHSGVFWAAFASETSVGIFTLWLFTRGRWKQAVV
jgi:putative MATE family efflux protein